MEKLPIKEKNMSLAVVINTTDKYSFLWNDWWHFFSNNWNHDYPVYFLNEKKDINFPVKQIKIDIPEIELWTKKLRESIKQIPEDNLFVILEDLFPVKKIDIDSIYKMFKTLSADALRVMASVSKYTTVHDTMFKINGESVKKLDANSRYLIAHTPNIWKKSFLLECLKTDENPWENEVTGSQRMAGKDYKIYAYLKSDWYVNVYKKGKITPQGQKLLKGSLTFK